MCSVTEDTKFLKTEKAGTLAQLEFTTSKSMVRGAETDVAVYGARHVGLNSEANSSSGV